MEQTGLVNIQEGFKTMKEMALILIRYLNIHMDKSDIIVDQININKQLSKDMEYYEFIRLLPELISQVNMIYKDIDNIKIVELESLNHHYVKFLINEIVNFNWEQMSYLESYSIENVERYGKEIDKPNITYTSQDHQALDALRWISLYYGNHLSILQDKIASIKIFDKIKDIDSNIVIIGANGTGKSTFARKLKGKLSDNTTILSAQRLLIYTDPDMVSRNNKELDSVHSFQNDDKLGSDPNLINVFKDDLNNLISALLKENADGAVDTQKGNKDEKESILVKVIDIWESLIINRKLEYTSDSIWVLTLDDKRYDFNCLSDGEKTIFYYAAHVLLAKGDSYIIVDEPNTHLHPTICNKLWDLLEQTRSDCKFIYITHDLDFATSRNDKVLLWNKKFEAPYTWEVERLEYNQSIPERLLMEIVGSKQEILFCEGDNKTSLDFKLYSILFKNYTIVPVGGHLNVINYCRAYNRNKGIYGQGAIGVIDRDCHNICQIERWEEDKIYTLKTNEIENLLFDEMIITSASKHFCCKEGTVESFKNKFFTELEKDKEQQSIWYANNTINNTLKSNILNENKDLGSLKMELQNIVNESSIQEDYDTRLSKLEEFIDNKNYEDALKICNFKGELMGHISKEIVDGYKDRIITFISNDGELQNEIRSKYLPMIES